MAIGTSDGEYYDDEFHYLSTYRDGKGERLGVPDSVVGRDLLNNDAIKPPQDQYPEPVSKPTRLEVAGDVVKFPFPPKIPDGQRGLTWDENKGEWTDLNAEIIKLPRVVDPRKRQSDSGEYKVAGWFSDLFSSKSDAKPSEPAVELAKPMTHYATAEDVQFAKDAGFYRDIYEPWTTGKIARVLRDNANFFTQGDDAEQTKEEWSKLVGGSPALAEVYAKGALVANRIPIAALGFDPDKVNMDMDPGKYNIVGSYAKKTDRIQMMASSASTIIHESIHRGLQYLRNNSDEAKDILKKPGPSEESLVRYLMVTQAGNPEQGEGKKGDEQIDKAKWAYEKSYYSDDYKKSLSRLTEIAQELNAKRYPSRGARQ